MHVLSLRGFHYSLQNVQICFALVQVRGAVEGFMLIKTWLHGLFIYAHTGLTLV
jgi:hypothetical protein